MYKTVVILFVSVNGQWGEWFESADKEMSEKLDEMQKRYEVIDSEVRTQ